MDDDFGGSPSPPTIPPPPATPTETDAEIQQREAEERKRQGKRRGRSQSILAGQSGRGTTASTPLEDEAAQVGKVSLLGGASPRA
jgi:hypothetical protein